MAEYYETKIPLIINEVGDVRTEVQVGGVILMEADGTLSVCNKEEVDAVVERINAEIVVRNEAIEVERVAKEEARIAAGLKRKQKKFLL